MMSFTASSIAQEASENIENENINSEEEYSLDDLEEIIVTATGTSIRGVAPVGSPVINISQETLLNAPTLDTTDFIRNLPQGSGLAPQEVSDEGGNIGRANGINLRGLGRNATLVLIDGHRLVGQGITESFADPNQLPGSAIKSIEIVTDAASSIYGSDAVAGVVNYILHDEYEGFEVNLRHTDTLYQSTTIDALGGFTWGSGNAWLGVLHEDRGTFRRSESEFLMDDLTRFGGPDNRISGRNSVPGAGAHIVAGGTIYGVPDTGGAIPTADDILALEGQYDLADSADYTDYWPERERTSVSLRARQELFDGDGEISFTGLYSKRESEFVQFNTFNSVNVTSRSPYWIPGIASRSYSYVYSFAYNNTGEGSIIPVTKPVDESLNLYVDFTYDFADDWQLALNYTNGKNEGCGNCGLRTNSSVFRDAFTSDGENNDGELYSDLFNPFVRGPQSEFLQDYYSPHNQETEFTMDRFTAKVDGPLLELPAGDLRVAAGVEHEETSNELYLYSYIFSSPPERREVRTPETTATSRDVSSAFLEAYIPVTDIFTVSASVRYDDYSDFGSTTNPRLAFSLDATDDITVRGSWSTAFRAPTLVETNSGILQQFSETNLANDGSHDIPVTDESRATTTVISRVGNTPGLKAEEADVMSFGIDYHNDSGFRASITYYDVEYSDRIESLPGQTLAISTSENRALYDSFITVAAQPDSCVEGDQSTYNPIYLDILNSVDYRLPRGGASDCDLEGIVSGGTVNVGQVNQSGLDIQLGYQWSTSFGEFSTNFSAAKILELEKVLLPGTPAIDSLDTIGEQNDLRATASFNWKKDNWSAGLSARYVDSYLNDQPITLEGETQAESKVPSWTTYGANVSYGVPKGDGEGFMDGVRIGLSIDNVFDRDPPVVLSSTSDRPFDTANANIFGRIVSLNLQKKF